MAPALPLHRRRRHPLRVVVVRHRALQAARGRGFEAPRRRQGVLEGSRRYTQRRSQGVTVYHGVTSSKAEKWMYDKYLRQAKLVDGDRPEGMPEAIGAFEDKLQETLPGGGFWSFDNPSFVVLVVISTCIAVQTTARTIFN
mmetsp:Transcript_53493/g.174089  ORF Transcript_53493/g.174089 Transcript_53493/m.174089 type:complete len:141 (-) Transcript_53493:60-482(-)